MCPLGLLLGSRDLSPPPSRFVVHFSLTAMSKQGQGKGKSAQLGVGVDRMVSLPHPLSAFALILSPFIPLNTLLSLVSQIVSSFTRSQHTLYFTPAFLSLPSLPPPLFDVQENFSEWYIQVLAKAELIEYTDISGCFVIRPSTSTSFPSPLSLFFASFIFFLSTFHSFTRPFTH